MDRTQLLKHITERYNAEEIHTLCFNLGIDYDNLAGSTKEAKARELIQFCERNDLLDQLDKAVQDRPKIALGRVVGNPNKTRNTIIAVLIIAGIFAVASPLINAVMPKPLNSVGVTLPTSTLTLLVNTITPHLPTTTPFLPRSTQTIAPLPTKTTDTPTTATPAEVLTTGTQVECDSTIGSAFAESDEYQAYLIALSPGDSLTVIGRSIGETLFFALDINDPSDTLIASNVGSNAGNKPLAKSGYVSAFGNYIVRASNGRSDISGAKRNGRGVGLYFLSFYCTRDGKPFPTGARSVPTTDTIVECGSTIQSEFTKQNEFHKYLVQLQPGDSLAVVGQTRGSSLAFSIDINDPIDTPIASNDGYVATNNPSAKSGVVSARGNYIVRTTNSSGHQLNQTGGSFTETDRQGRSIGQYVLSFNCTRDGKTYPTSVEPTQTAEHYSAISSFGFPLSLEHIESAPLFFSKAQQGTITTKSTDISAFEFEAKANDVLDLSFARKAGNLNLGLVVLSANNKVVYQTSLVTSSAMTTKLTLPTAGTYTIGIFKIELNPPAKPTATRFEITAQLNP